MERQALELLWPLFNIGRFLGCFPCKKVVNTESGTKELKPMDWKLYWMLYFAVGLPFTLAGPLMSTLVFYFETGKISGLYDCIIMLNPHLAESYIDQTLQLLMSGFTFLLVFTIQFQNSKLKDFLCIIPSFGLQRSKRSNWKILKPLLTFYVTASITCCLNATMPIYILFKCQLASLHWFIYLLMFLMQILSLCVMNFPLSVFFGITLEYFILIEDVCQQLQSKPFESSIKRSMSLWKCIETVRKMLSSNIFYITIILSIEMLILLYIFSFGIVINVESMTFLEKAFGKLFIISFFLCFFLLYWYMNILSQRITEQVHGLADYLRHVNISNESEMIVFKGHDVPLSTVKTCLLKKFDDFQGFDGKGYFTLGKSLLKNLLAFCVTYLVILVQFRMTERSDSGQEHFGNDSKSSSLS